MSVLMPDTLAFSQDADGVPTFDRNGEDLLLSGVASVTKVMTLWVARKWLPTDADLDATTTVGSDRSSRVVPGDVVSLRDLMYLCAVPSDNAAPPTVAEYVGGLLVDQDVGTGTPMARFRQQMAAEADALGYVGASFPGTVGDGVMSARQVVDLFQRSMADPVLRGMYSAMEYTVEVVGGPNPRLVPTVHTMTATTVELPGLIGGKTGSFGGRAHLVIAWEHPDGTEHVTAVLNTDLSQPEQRYTEMRKVMDITRSAHEDVVGGLRVPFVIGGVAVSGHVVADNQGNAAAPARVRVHGPVQRPQIRHSESRATLTFDLILDEGQWLDIDLDARTVLLNGQASRRGRMRGEWFDLAPGVNTIEFSSLTDNPDARLEVFWRDAYR